MKNKKFSINFSDKNFHFYLREKVMIDILSDFYTSTMVIWRAESQSFSLLIEKGPFTFLIKNPTFIKSKFLICNCFYDVDQKFQWAWPQNKLNFYDYGTLNSSKIFYRDRIFSKVAHTQHILCYTCVHACACRIYKVEQKSKHNQISLVSFNFYFLILCRILLLLSLKF